METETIENPMGMAYREAFAWQLGYEQGWKQCKADLVLRLKGLIRDDELNWIIEQQG
jgi:hypothetical protein